MKWFVIKSKSFLLYHNKVHIRIRRTSTSWLHKNFLRIQTFCFFASYTIPQNRFCFSSDHTRHKVIVFITSTKKKIETPGLLFVFGARAIFPWPSLASKAIVYTINKLIATLHAEILLSKQGDCSHKNRYTQDIACFKPVSASNVSVYTIAHLLGKHP